HYPDSFDSCKPYLSRLAIDLNIKTFNTPLNQPFSRTNQARAAHHTHRKRLVKTFSRQDRGYSKQRDTGNPTFAHLDDKSPITYQQQPLIIHTLAINPHRPLLHQPQCL
ncbi:hypothetical protein C7443_1141, partial [Plasticicumulans acidivorans]